MHAVALAVAAVAAGSSAAYAASGRQNLRVLEVQGNPPAPPFSPLVFGTCGDDICAPFPPSAPPSPPALVFGACGDDICAPFPPPSSPPSPPAYPPFSPLVFGTCGDDICAPFPSPPNPPPAYPPFAPLVFGTCGDDICAPFPSPSSPPSPPFSPLVFGTCGDDICAPFPPSDPPALPLTSPSPIPPPLPPFPPDAVLAHVVTTSFAAAGDVSDYDTQTLSSIAQIIATAALVDVSQVTVSVVPGSVRIDARISFPDQATAQATAAALVAPSSDTPNVQPIFASTTALATALASAQVVVASIEAAPAHRVINLNAPLLPPPPMPPTPPSPPASRGWSGDRRTGMASVGAAFGTVVGCLVIAGSGYLFLRKRGLLKGPPTIVLASPANVQSAATTSTQAAHIEMTVTSQPVA